MLRECFRVLEPGGRLAMFVIHTSPGLSAAEEEEAAEWGPTDVRSERPLDRLVLEASFEPLSVLDVTEAFAETCRSIRDAREAAAADLRAEEGDKAYEVEQDKKEHMLRGITDGLLRRTLVVASKSIAQRPPPADPGVPTRSTPTPGSRTDPGSSL